MKKKVLALMIATTMIAGMLSACGGEKASTEEAGETKVEETSDEAENTNETENTDDTDDTDGTTELVFWHCMSDVYLENLETMVEEFNNGIGAEENIHVKMVFQDWPGTSALMTALQAKDYDNLPDVFQMYAVGVNQLRDNERMVWVEDLLNMEGSTVTREDLVEQPANAFTIDGKMFGAPMNMSGILMYYNKDLFKEAGLDPENPPATIAEMAEAATALGNVCDYGITLRPDSYEVESWIEGQGEGTYFGNNENGHTGYMTDIEYDKNGRLHDFLTEWDKVVNCGSFKYVKDDYNSEFVSEQTAMLIMSSSKLSTLYELTEGKFELGVAPLPTVNADDKGGIALGGSGIFAMDNGDEKKLDAAAKFIQYLLSEEMQTKTFTNMGYFPSNKACLENEEVLAMQEEYPGFKTFVDVVLNSNPDLQSAFVLNYDDMNGIFQDTMLQYDEGSISMEEAETILVDDVRKSINDYLRANPVEE